MVGLDTNLTGMLAGGPELIQTPSLALGLAQGMPAVQVAGSPPVTPQSIGAAGSLASAAQGLTEARSALPQAVPQVPAQHPHSGLFGWLSGKFGDAMNMLNAPLREVQHQYRYFHDVWERHGVLAALGEMGVAAGAGAVATAFGGPQAGILAAEAVSGVEGRLTFGDSWKATADGATYRDLHTGLAVSPGEDMANLIGHIVNGKLFHGDGYNYRPNKGVDMPTGAINAVFDLTFDPLMKAGAVLKEARATGITLNGERGLQVAGKTFGYGNVPKLLVDSEGNKATDILDIYHNNPGVNDAFNRMAGMSTKQIITEWPSLRQEFAGQLGKAQSGDEVASIFANAINVRNYSFVQHGLPTTSLTRRIAGNVGLSLPSKGQVVAGIQNFALGERGVLPGVQVLKDADGAPIMSKLDPASPVMTPTATGRVLNQFTSYAPFAFNSKTLDLSAREGNPADPEFMRALYSVVRHSQDAATANNVLAKYIEAPLLSEKLNIIGNAYRDAFRASGLPDDAEIVQKFAGGIDHLVKSATNRVYMTDEAGNAIKFVDAEGNATNMGLLLNQQGSMAFPDFAEWKTAIADAKGGFYGRLVNMGDSINRQLMTKFFKRLVLLSGGFALRVASGELIPAMLHQSAREVAQSGLAAAAMKLHPESLFDLAPEGELDGLKGVRATIPGRRDVGRIADFDATRRTVTVRFADGTAESLPANRALLYHRDVTTGDVAQLARDMRMDVSSAEVPHLKAAIGKALFGIPHALVDPAYRDVAGMNIIKNDGHIVAEGLSSDHEPARGFGGMRQNMKDTLNELGRKVVGNENFTDQFRLYNPGQAEHPLMWNQALKEAVADPGMRAHAAAFRDVIANGGSKEAAQRAGILADRGWMEGNSATAADFRANMAHYNRSPAEMAALRAEGFKGLVYGRQGQFLHEQVLQDMAEGQATPIHDLLETNPADRPTVKGREIAPGAEQPTSFDKVVQAAWKPLHQTINSLSRAPLWTMYVTDEYKMYQPWIDAGLMTKSEAHDIAQVRALNRMLPNIHNTMLRSQFALASRNVYPFYFAQEQAYKRYFRAAFADPLAFREATLALHGLTSSGAITSDPQGNRYISFPGMGAFGTMVTSAFTHMGLPFVGGVPGQLSGDTISLRSVIPEGNAPSFSPLVAVPLKALADHWHSADPFVKSVLGNVSYNSSMDAELIPNATIRRLWEAVDPNAQTQAFGETYSQTAAWAAHKANDLWSQAEKIDPRATDPRVDRSLLNPAAAALMAKADTYLPMMSADPGVTIQANQKLRNSTRILLMIKAAVGMVSPLSPQMQVGDIKLRNEYAQYIKQYGIIQGHQMFMDKNPNATADTVFQSSSPSGSYIPATKAALDWLDKNYSWATRNKLVAAYLMPQDPGAYNTVAYHEELQAKLRQKYNDLAPADGQANTFLGALYTSMGNAEYIPSLKDYQAARAQAAGDSYTLHNLSQTWQAYVQDLSQRNPVWYDSEFAATKYTTALQSYNELAKAVNSPNTPQSSQMDVAKELIASYQDFQAQDALIKSGQGSMTQTELKQSWYDYLDQMVQQNPAAQPIAYGIFRRLASKA